MMIRRGRAGRAVPATMRVAGTVLVALVSVALPTGPAQANGGTVSDPRELGTRLDLKSLTHSDEGSSVIYTAETFAPFTDDSAAFKWGIDRNGDEDFDLFVVAEWRSGRLVGGVRDAKANEIAAANISRPSPTSIQVSFPLGVLEGTSVYRYAVNAGDDLAPNAGLSQHRLGALVAGGTAPARAASAAPRPSAAPKPSAAPAPEASAAPPPEAAGAPPAASLPTTGPDGGRTLLPVAGAAFLLGGALIGGSPRRRIRRS